METLSMKPYVTQYIFIDPSAQTAERKFIRLDCAAMLAIIGCESFEAICLLSGDLVWFDGERVEYGVELDGIEIEGTPVLGSRCLITGPVDRRTEMPGNCRMTAKDALAVIKWTPRRKIIGKRFQLTSAGFEITYAFEPA
jgi:hypothetical protein